MSTHAKKTLRERIKAQAESLFHIREDTVPGRRWPLRLGKLAVLTIREINKDLCLERAAALSFTTTVCFIPMAILLLFLFGNMGQFDELVTGAKEFVVEYLVVEQEADAASAGGTETGAGSDTAATPRAADPTVGKEGSPAKSARQEVRDQIDKLTEALKAPLLQASGLINALAMVVLLLTVSSLFRTAERNFSVVWSVQVRKGFVQKLGKYWLLLTLPVIILVLATLLKRQLDEFLGDGFLGRTTHAFFGVSVSFFAFMVVFRYLPNTRVKLNAAAVGAFVAAIGWELGTRAFGLYVQYAVLGSFYGAIGVIPFFLVFVYFAWFLALVGAEISYCIQNYTVLEREVRFHISESRVARPIRALLVLERIYRGFRGDHASTTMDDLATEFQMPLSLTQDVLEKLVAAGYVVTDANGTITPTRAADRVQLLEVTEVYPAGLGLNLDDAGGGDTRLHRLLAGLAGDVKDQLQSKTLRDLLEVPSDAAVSQNSDQPTT